MARNWFVDSSVSGHYFFYWTIDPPPQHRKFQPENKTIILFLQHCPAITPNKLIFLPNRHVQLGALALNLLNWMKDFAVGEKYRLQDKSVAYFD